MPRKMGRPKIDNPKIVDLKVRIDEETSRKLTAYCKKNDVSRAEAVRQGIYLLMAKK